MSTTTSTTSTSARTRQPRNAMGRGLSVLLACCLAFAGMTFGFAGAGRAHADAPVPAPAGADPTDQEMKPEATFSGVEAENAVFDNTSHAGYTGTPLAHYDTPDGTQKQYTGGFEISYQDEDGNLLEGEPVNAGTYTVWIVIPANAECRGQTSREFTIAKANAPASLEAQEALMLDMAGYEKNVSIGRVIEHQLKNFGEATFIIASSTYTGLSAASTSFFDVKATLDLVSNGNGGNATDTVTIDLKDIGNYTDTSITYTIGYRVKLTTTDEIQYVTAETGLVYNGAPQKGYEGDPSIRYTPYDLTADKMYSGPFDIAYTGIDGTAYGPTAQAPTNAGTYRVTLAVPESAEFFGPSKAVEFAIAKAPLPLEDLSAELLDAAGFQDVLDLASWLNVPVDTNGGPTYSVDGFTTNGLASAAIDPDTGKLTLVASGTAGTKSDTVAVKLSGMGNYEDTVVETKVDYAAKPVATIDGVQAATGLVYNGAPQAGYTGTPQATYLPHRGDLPETYDGPFDIAYAGTSADGSAYGPTAQAPASAGTYRVTFAVPQDASFAGSLTLEFAIAKAPLVFRAQDASMTAGDAVPALSYQVEGLKGADRVTQEPRLTVEGDTTKAGSCTIAVSGGAVDNQASYDVSHENAALRVSATPVVPDPIEPEPDQPAPPADKPEPAKPTPLPTKGAPADGSTALATTGDSALPNLIAVVAGIAALAAGIALVRIHANRRRS